MGEKYLTIKLTLTQLNNYDTQDAGNIACEEETRFRSRIEQSPLGASRGAGSDFKISAEEMVMIDKFIAKMRTKRALSKPEVTRLGKKLFSLIFSNAVLEKYNQCIGRLPKGVKLRLAIAILAEELVKIPWEYLHDGSGFLLQSNHSIVRIIDELPEKKAPFGPLGPLLIAIANPDKNKPDAQFIAFDADAHQKKVEDRLKQTDIRYEILNPCKRQELKERITSGKFGALYFAGHGIFTPNQEGQLILENDQNGEDPLDATELAQWLNSPDSDSPDYNIRFAYLNSCSTAKNTTSNPFAGVAQRLMRDGEIYAVVAMQTDVEQMAAFDIAAGFFEELRLRRGKSPEEAMALARTKGGDAHSWGVPVIYSYLTGPEDFDRNRLAYFLSAKPGESTYGLFLPSFVFGVLVEELPKEEIKLEPPQPYFYPDETLALSDTQSGLDVIRLLTPIALPEQIKLWRTGDQHKADGSHWFIFGSRSNKIVESILGEKDFKARFKFDYKNQPGKWILIDTELEASHSIDAPHKDEDYDKKTDIGVIEKIVAEGLGMYFFLLSGLGDRATRGCGWYLYEKWSELLSEFGDSPFGIVLKFPGGFGFDRAIRLDKKPETKS